MKDQHSISADEKPEDGEQPQDGEQPDDGEQPEESLSRPGLISVYELRAMGALDVPPSWRKWLGGKPFGGKREFYPLFDEPGLHDGPRPEEQQAAEIDSEDDASDDDDSEDDELEDDELEDELS